MKFSPQFLHTVASSAFVKNLDEGRVLIDNSEFSTWGSCFSMGLYAGALKRVNSRSRTPLAFGAAVHAGLERFFKGHANWREYALQEATAQELDSLGDPKRNTDKLMDLLEAYVLEYERHPEMQFKILRVEDQLGVEQSFTVPLGQILVNWRGQERSIDILWMGKIDLLTEYDNSIAPVDHKTTTVMGEKFADDKVRSSQMLGYTYAARYLSKELFNGLPVFGVRINALAMRSAGFEFKQFDIPFPDWKVAEWQMEQQLKIKELIHELSDFLITGDAVPTREHCVTKYGKCAYFDVCDSVPAMRDRMIFDDAYFYVSEWSPLD